MRKDNKGFWQFLAPIYNQVAENDGKFYDDLCARFLPFLNEKMSVLELACGTGQLSRRMAGSAHRWDATDFSERMIGQAKKKGETEKLHFYVADATKLSCGSGSFDAVVISCALHIMPEPEEALAEIEHVLKPGGLLYCPTYLWAENGASKLWQKVMSLAGLKVYRKWTMEGFISFIKMYGFCVLKQEVLTVGIAPVGMLIAKKVHGCAYAHCFEEEKHYDK